MCLDGALQIPSSCHLNLSILENQGREGIGQAVCPSFTDAGDRARWGHKTPLWYLSGYNLSLNDCRSITATSHWKELSDVQRGYRGEWGVGLALTVQKTTFGKNKMGLGALRQPQNDNGKNRKYLSLPATLAEGR